MRPSGAFGTGPWALWVLLTVGHPRVSVIRARCVSSTPHCWVWWLEHSLGLAAHTQVLGTPWTGHRSAGCGECEGPRATEDT